MSDDLNNIFEESAEAEYIDPPKVLKGKVGTGGISTFLIERAQEAIEENTKADFTEYANGYLSKIREAMAKAQGEKKQSIQNAHARTITENIMMLKANGGMYGYYLITSISEVALHFADSVKKYNDDYFKIIDAHNNSIALILGHKLKGDGGNVGSQLVKELRDAVQRYNKKHIPKED